MTLEPLTVLISSVSKKVPLVKSVRRAIEKLGREGKLIGADLDPQCLGSHFVDQFWEMPAIDVLTVEELISYCQFYHVNCIIPTRDGELSFYAQHRGVLFQQGIHVMVSSLETTSLCHDKLQFYRTIQQLGYPAIETAEDPIELETDAFVVKERFGAGGVSVGLNLTMEEANQWKEQLQHPIFQPYIEGEETSADLYIDQKGDVKGCVLRKRDYIENGESRVTTTYRDEAVEQMCCSLARELEGYGHLLFQLIHGKENGVHYIVECNPRFGGASTLSIAAGLDVFYWFFKESLGESLESSPFQPAETSKCLVRHAEDFIV